MDRICIVDTETTGLDHTKGKVLEIAAVLFHIPTRSILAQASVLCYNETNEAYDVNRIDPESLKAVSPAVQIAGWQNVKTLMEAGDALVAHNAEFDKKWIETLAEFQEVSRNKKWICTRNDVIWNVRKGCALNLIHICADLGVPIVNAHRALADCLLLADAINTNEDIEHFLDKSGKGRLVYHAKVNYEERQLVKDAGFLWDNMKKVWHAKLTPEQAASMPFMVYPAESSCPAA